MELVDTNWHDLRLNGVSEKQLDTRRIVFLGIDIVGVTGSIPVRSTKILMQEQSSELLRR